MAELTKKQLFLKELDQMLPDDAFFFEFHLAYTSLKGARVMAGVAPTGLIISGVSRTPEMIDPAGRARYSIEGQLV